MKKLYKLLEVDLVIVVSIHPKKVPENVVELPLRAFVQDLDSKSFEFLFYKVSFVSLVIAIEILLKLAPNQLHKIVLLGTHSFYDRLWLKFFLPYLLVDYL